MFSRACPTSTMVSGFTLTQDDTTAFVLCARTDGSFTVNRATADSFGQASATTTLWDSSDAQQQLPQLKLQGAKTSFGTIILNTNRQAGGSTVLYISAWDASGQAEADSIMAIPTDAKTKARVLPNKIQRPLGLTLDYSRVPPDLLVSSGTISTHQNVSRVSTGSAVISPYQLSTPEPLAAIYYDSTASFNLLQVRAITGQMFSTSQKCTQTGELAVIKFLREDSEPGTTTGAIAMGGRLAVSPSTKGYFAFASESALLQINSSSYHYTTDGHSGFGLASTFPLSKLGTHPFEKVAPVAGLFVTDHYLYISDGKQAVAGLSLMPVTPTPAPTSPPKPSFKPTSPPTDAPTAIPTPATATDWIYQAPT